MARRLLCEPPIVLSAEVDAAAFRHVFAGAKAAHAGNEIAVVHLVDIAGSRWRERMRSTSIGERRLPVRERD